MDLGSRESQIVIIGEGGELITRRIRTERPVIQRFFRERPHIRVLMEASTESEWVARCIEELGHEVVVGDPNYAPMYSQRNRRVKTDLRDGMALAKASKLGAYRPAHRTSDPRRHIRALLAARDAVVRTRVRYIALTRSLLKREGVRVPSGGAETFPARWARVEIPAHLREETAPLITLMAPLTEQIGAFDRALESLGRRDEAVRRLMTCPEIGPLTAICFVATLDQAERFARPHQVASYLGLVPSEWSSGESQHKGAITKAGSPRCRCLLVEAAHRLLAVMVTMRSEAKGSEGVDERDLSVGSSRAVMHMVPRPRIPPNAPASQLASNEREENDDEPRGCSTYGQRPFEGERPTKGP